MTAPAREEVEKLLAEAHDEEWERGDDIRVHRTLQNAAYDLAAGTLAYHDLRDRLATATEGEVGDVIKQLRWLNHEHRRKTGDYLFYGDNMPIVTRAIALLEALAVRVREAEECEANALRALEADVLHPSKAERERDEALARAERAEKALGRET